jgi:hypothetical protein
MMHTPRSRRHFLTEAAGLTAAALLPQNSPGQLVAPAASQKKVAAIVTTYHRYAHADNIVTRFMEGYSIVGKSYPPPCKVASLWMDQVAENDIGIPLARHWKIPLASSIREALTLGGDKLAVDGVVIVAEQGEYPINDRGQRLYPRRKFFEEVVKVFRDTKQTVPVFNDKHLSWSWDDAKWMYDQSKELGFPIMAGSSVPVTHRKPDLRPEIGTEFERALSIGYGHFEVYGFHTLEALQVMTERRKGGETGVKAVQALSGEEAWAAAKAGKWDRELLDAALATVPNRGKGKVEDEDKDALVYLIEYRDGLQAAAYMSPKHSHEWAFAGKVKGKTQPLSTWYDLPKPQRDHFSFLVDNVAKMFVTGKATYPVERTLLTGGMLTYLMQSKASGGKRIETPQLKVEYQAV